MKNKINIPTLSKLSSVFLKIGSTFMALVFFYILFLLLKTPESEKAWLYANAYTMLEYAIMSFTLVLCGTFLLDIGKKGL